MLKRLPFSFIVIISFISCDVSSSGENDFTFPSTIASLGQYSQQTATVNLGLEKDATVKYALMKASSPAPNKTDLLGITSSSSLGLDSGVINLSGGEATMIELNNLIKYNDHILYLVAEVEEQQSDLYTLAIRNKVNALSEKGAQLGHLFSTVVSVGGQVVFEGYFNGHQVDQLEDARSVSKGVTALVVGKAIELGYYNLSSTIGGYFPSKYLDGLELEKKNITVWQLLTMSSGLGYFENEYNQWIRVPDEIEVVLDRDLRSVPGEVFDYSTPNLQMLSVIHQEATGKTLLEFGKEHIFSPLGIENVQWVGFETGYTLAGSALNMSTRDFLKIGEMVIQDGVYNNQQVLNDAFLNEMHSSKFSYASYLTTGNKVTNQWFGYLWWEIDYGNLDGYMTSGYGGQNIILFPSLELVITTNSEWRVNGTTASQQQIEVWSYVTEIVDATK